MDGSLSLTIHRQPEFKSDGAVANDDEEEEFKGDDKGDDKEGVQQQQQKQKQYFSYGTLTTCRLSEEEKDKEMGILPTGDNGDDDDDDDDNEEEEEEEEEEEDSFGGIGAGFDGGHGGSGADTNSSKERSEKRLSPIFSMALAKRLAKRRGSKLVLAAAAPPLLVTREPLSFKIIRAGSLKVLQRSLRSSVRLVQVASKPMFGLKAKIAVHQLEDEKKAKAIAALDSAPAWKRSALRLKALNVEKKKRRDMTKAQKLEKEAEEVKMKKFEQARSMAIRNKGEREAEEMMFHVKMSQKMLAEKRAAAAALKSPTTPTAATNIIPQVAVGRSDARMAF